MPASFRYPSRAQLWVPLDMDGKAWARAAITGPAPSAGLNRSRVPDSLADLKLIAQRLEQTYPDSNDKVGATALLLHDDLSANPAFLLMMLSAVGLVLLIACANVAISAAFQGHARQKEMAVRSALGAARARLLRQLLTESLLLSLLGGFWCAAAWGIVALFSQARLSGIPQFAIIQLNGEVLASPSRLAVATGVLFGIVRRCARPVPISTRTERRCRKRHQPGRRRRSTSNALVAAEWAVAAAAGLGRLLLKISRGCATWISGCAPRACGPRRCGCRDFLQNRPQNFTFSQSLLEKSARSRGWTPPPSALILLWRAAATTTSRSAGRRRRNGATCWWTTIPSLPAISAPWGVRLLQGRLFTQEDVDRTLALEERWRQLTEGGGRLLPIKPMPWSPHGDHETMARFFWPNRIRSARCSRRAAITGPGGR